MPASVLARAMASLEPCDSSTATMILLMTFPCSGGDGNDGMSAGRSDIRAGPRSTAGNYGPRDTALTQRIADEVSEAARDPG